MAFQDPPSILAGITHPQVIQTPGAGDAMAGGLNAVLAAFLQKQQLDQQHQEVQANIGSIQAQTQHEMKLADLTDADTANAKQKLKDAQQASEDAKEQHTLQTGALGFVAANAGSLGDGQKLGQAITDGISHGIIKPEHIPYILDAVGKTGNTMNALAEASRTQAQASTEAAQAPYAGPTAAAKMQEAQGAPGLQKAQTALAWANAQKARAEAQKAGQGGDLKPLPQKARETIVSQRDMLTQIDQAMQMLQANPNAIGPAKGMIPAHVLDIFDSNPGNVATRAALQNIRADRLHSLYGSRLTKTEIEQGSQIFADVRTPSKVALTKLQQLRARIAKLNEGYEKGLVGQGYKPFAGDDAAEVGATPTAAAPAAAPAAPPVDYQSRYIQLRKQGMSATQAYKALQGQ